MQFGFGSGVLTGTRTDIANASPVKFGALQNVDIEFGGETKELYAVNQYPIDTARGKTKVSGKAKVAEIKGHMYNDLFFGLTLNTGSTRYAWNESVPSLGASYTVANAASPPIVDQGVFYGVSGNQLYLVSSGPSTGQYSFVGSTGVYTFAAGDAGQAVLVSYTYHATTGFNIPITNPLMGNTPRFSVTLFQTFENNQVVLVLNACVSTRLTFPTRLDDYVLQDLDFGAFADAGGNVGVWSTTN